MGISLPIDDDTGVGMKDEDTYIAWKPLSAQKPVARINPHTPPPPTHTHIRAHTHTHM